MNRWTTLSAAALCGGLLAGPALAADETFTLTILHNNDGESQLIDLGAGLEDFGGVARFATLVDDLRTDAIGAGNGVVLLSSGDNFLAGPEFNASIENGIPYYDAVALDMIGYDAFCIGNHEFDFGPQTLANFINSFSTNPAPWLSSNLDFTPEEALEPLATSGRIAASTIVETAGQQIGIVGATTPNLPFISSPGAVITDDDVAGSIQAEVDALTLAGVDKIIVIAHLQSVQEDVEIISSLTGVDVFIAGGGDELLANEGDLLIPGDEKLVFGDYPLEATDALGETVRVVTTKGAYAYVGRLVVTFDRDGVVTSVGTESGPVRVAGGDQPDAVLPDSTIQSTVVDPVIAYVDDLDTTVIGTTEVPLDGRRSSIRSRETNQGNLIADAFLWQATQLADDFDVPAPLVAVGNGGGIRNDSIIPIGDLTLLDTFDMLPFSNFITVLPDVTIEELEAVLENAVSRIDPQPGFPTDGSGRFAQVAGVSFEYVVTNVPGERIRSITLDDGTPLTTATGEKADGAPGAIPVATVNFLATGGDEYPFVSPFTSLGVTYQQALANFIEDGLGGVVSAAGYPVGGERRIAKIDADLNDDFLVDTQDLLGMLADFGCEGDCGGDVNDDGVVDTLDILELLALWTI